MKETHYFCTTYAVTHSRRVVTLALDDALNQARQITSSQDTMEEAAKLSERQDGGEHDGIKATETSSSRECTSPASQNPVSGFQASVNPNFSNPRPNLNYAFGGNPFTLQSSNPSSELKLAPSRFQPSFNSGTGLNSSSSVSFSKPVLRPPQLMGTSSLFSSSNSGSSSSLSSSPFQSKPGYSLNPSKLGNPFAKVSSEPKAEEDKDAGSGPSKEKEPAAVSSKTGSESAPVVAPKFVPLGKKEGVERTDLSSSSSSLSPTVSIQASPHSKPSSTESTSPKSFTTRASHSSISASPASSGFVFGQNLHERVEASAGESSGTGASPQVNGVNLSSEGGNSGSLAATTAAFGANKEEKCQGASTNGDSEMLFSSVLKRESNLERLNNDGGEGSHSKSLSEAAREYEESRAVKRKYEEVTIITGEEDEDNVLQITCKLFAFNIAKSSWVERGRGQLRVNDKSDPEKHSKKQSRLVMRTQGSLRVVLNTKIWAGMSVVRASPKSIRMTAMDENQIKVFLLMASPADTERLLNVLVCRVEAQKQLEEEVKVGGKEHDRGEPETCTIEIPSPAKRAYEGKNSTGDGGGEETKTGCAKECLSAEESGMAEERQHSDREAST
ncbi:ran-binding protein 3 isoform X2 [Ischnura elegans]|uniref:ran-binding protein 3 isoform X2 n=1 Tax=Ischnura elegans TaxID=197161 RepID=UPI001ED86819|nr:ran-binding protein 3 isoform X2 [Ischnura elegans]